MSQQATEKQLAFLRSLGAKFPATLTKAEAAVSISSILEARKRGKNVPIKPFRLNKPNGATPSQKAYLVLLGAKFSRSLTKKAAASRIDRILKAREALAARERAMDRDMMLRIMKDD